MSGTDLGLIGLLAAARRLDPEAGERLGDGGWKARMAAAPLGDLYYYPTISSTNERVRELARQGARAGTLVLAEEQTEGRGRHGRGWYSPPGGGLYASILLEPGLEADRIGWLTLLAALSLVRAGRDAGCDLRIKWPNDVRCQGLKVAGVLAEAITQGGRIRQVVLGTGVNVVWEAERIPEPLRERATALSLCGGRTLDRDALLADYLTGLYGLLARLDGGEDGMPAVAPEVLARLEHLGETVRVRQGDGEVSGLCTGLTPEGYLELDGGRSVAAGELVTLRQEDGL
jgi:BirA family biotin operon repressor/biotin-[acetyl-CoA-carboxylase] ligase